MSIEKRGKKNWESLIILSAELNEKSNYLIMRNFEQMAGNDCLIKGHEDIDFLCDDPEQLIRVLSAFPRKFFNKKVQNYILFKGKKVKVDIRYVGDGYYDKQWQQDMLKRKVMAENGFCTMNGPDYFYSLVYHAILQKKRLSEEYLGKLIQMAKKLGLDVRDEAGLLELLKMWMDRNGYRFVYPLDGTVPNRFGMFGIKPKGRIPWIIRKYADGAKQFVYAHVLQRFEK